MTDEQKSEFSGKRVLITSVDRYMGPAITARFEEEGAVVITDATDYAAEPTAPERIVREAGHIDILVANLHATPSFDAFNYEYSADVSDAEWRKMFAELTDPLMRFTRAVLPQMIERRQGKIVAVTSALSLRMSETVSSYSAARGAQNAYVRAVGSEVGRHNVQINAVAQNYVYGGYPDDAMERPEIRDAVMRDVPARRLASGREQSELVLFLASNRSDFFCGQVVPFAGGWAW